MTTTKRGRLWAFVCDAKVWGLLFYGSVGALIGGPTLLSWVVMVWVFLCIADLTIDGLQDVWSKRVCLIAVEFLMQMEGV